MKTSQNHKWKSADIVKELRKAAGLSQSELAEEIECSEQTISNIECGRYLSSDKAIKIAKLFKVPLHYVQGNIEKPGEYKAAILESISLMQRYATALETFAEYLLVTAGKKKSTLTDAEKETLMQELEWYGSARLQKMLKERGRENNGKETK